MLSFGLPGRSDSGFMAEAARRVSAAGFGRLWINDTPMADGVSDAVAAADSVPTLNVGIGVVAVDRWTPRRIVDALGSHATSGRVTCGVGAGFSERPLVATRHAVAGLREIVPTLPVAVAAMGPKMCALAGEIADIVLLNWMTPERIDWAKEHISAGAARAGRELPKVAAYVRIASGPAPGDMLALEAARYAALPHYARHFEAMGVPAPGVATVGDPKPALARYLAVCDEVVVRPLAETMERMLDAVEAVKP